MRIGLVGCVKSKRESATLAKDLYTSTLFRGRREYVERTCDRWFILSAQHGLLDVDSVVEPYDMRLADVSAAEQRAWSQNVVDALVGRLGDLRGITFEIHAGAAYRDNGVTEQLRARGATVVNPTEGLNQGQQLAFYRGPLRRGGPPAPPLGRAAEPEPRRATDMPSTGDDVEIELGPITEAGPFEFQWPVGGEHFERSWEFVAQYRDRRFRLRHAVGRRSCFGRDRVHSVTFVDGWAAVEGAETEDYRATRALASILKADSRSMVRPSDPVPPGYVRLDVVVHRDEVIGPRARNGVGSSDAEADRLATNLTQLPFFAQGSSNSIRFAQELIEQYFLGEELCRLLDGNIDTFRRRLRAGVLRPDSLSLQMVVDHVERKKLSDAVARLVVESPPSSVEFRNLLQMAALGSTRARVLRDGAVSVEFQDLRGIAFIDCDLAAVSFRGSDLTDVSFQGCGLEGTNLEDAVMMSTSFDESSCRRMKGARVGVLRHFFSIETPDGRIAEAKQAADWFDRMTGVQGEFAEPCAAAKQLRHLLRKYIRPDGQPRRDSLNEKALLRGAQIASPKDTLNALVRYRYLTAVPPHGHFKRADGDQYREMVEFVRDQQLSPGLRTLLGDICRERECTHVPKPGDTHSY